MAIRNIVRNAVRVGYPMEMLRKVRYRFEPSQGLQATAWATTYAEDLDAWCKRIDEQLWSEVCDWTHDDRAPCERILLPMGVNMGGGGAYPLVFFLVRALTPHIVVETGVAAGWTSRAALSAMAINGFGQLYSSDFPYFRHSQPEQDIGILVPEELRSRWVLNTRGDRVALPQFAQRCRDIALIHYDSDKSYAGRRFATTILAACSETSLWVMDDIQDNLFFRDWVGDRDWTFRVFEFEGKFLGLTGPGLASIEAKHGM